ncbi:MAG TPA: hypothetical protein VD736_09445 [Nitrososphaera sp.]|nr:hypothetical protein [Nitrososphaera sp.]
MSKIKEAIEPLAENVSPPATAVSSSVVVALLVSVRFPVVALPVVSVVRFCAIAGVRTKRCSEKSENQH